jgi:predicted O-methyltransferase YrrM
MRRPLSRHSSSYLTDFSRYRRSTLGSARIPPTRPQLAWRCPITASTPPTAISWEYAENWLEEPEAIREARARAEDLGCQPVSAAAAATLELLAASVQAQAIVEVGTGTGVSGAALLRGITPGGVLTSIDIEAESQRVARETLAALGFDHLRARLIAGRALEVLPRMSDAAYDMVVIDGDRAEYPAALAQAKRLLRIGGLVVFVGVLDENAIADPARRDPETIALRDTAAQLRDDDDWLPALITSGSGLLVGALRGRS